MICLNDDLSMHTDVPKHEMVSTLTAALEKIFPDKMELER